MSQQLSYHQTRQATMLLYFSSLDYLRGLKRLIDELIESLEPAVERAERLGVDKILTNERWGVSDTVANWGSGAYPFLLEMQLQTAKDIAERDAEIYSSTHVNFASRGINEHSMLWATAEQEKMFRQQLEAINVHAEPIDIFTSWHNTGSESLWENVWRSTRSDPKLKIPKFVVRESIIGKTGLVPTRTGIYVPQRDPYGACQFRWTGNAGGQLLEAKTLNALGRSVVAKVGHKYLWADDGKLTAVLKSAQYIDAFSRDGRVDLFPGRVDDPITASAYLSKFGIESVPADWFYVEAIEGEYDDDADADQTSDGAVARDRIEGGKPCSQSGWWLTPARVGSRRYFNAGEVMPDFGASSDYGQTIWQWDADQSSPSL